MKNLISFFTMTPKQFRIGNYIQTPSGIKTIAEIRKSDIGIAPSGELPWIHFPFELCNPLALTEDLLLKFGFKKDSDNIWGDGKCLFWLDSGILQIALGYTPLLNCPCKYVHQLQNLHFALTGHELEEQLSKTQVSECECEGEPYFGWCNVEGCEREGANGGGCWRETGYWTVCSKHSTEWREGKPQPPMKQSAVDREKTRKADGTLPPKMDA